MTVTVRAESADRKAGMTLREAADFLEQARVAGCPDDTYIEARTTIRGRVTKLETS